MNAGKVEGKYWIKQPPLPNLQTFFPVLGIAPLVATMLKTGRLLTYLANRGLNIVENS